MEDFPAELPLQPASGCLRTLAFLEVVFREAPAVAHQSRISRISGGTSSREAFPGSPSCGEAVVCLNGVERPQFQTTRAALRLLWCDAEVHVAGQRAVGRLHPNLASGRAFGYGGLD